ncbi:MAG: glycine--tRNA ligase subunit beta [Vicinamibacterales bacterium]
MDRELLLEIGCEEMPASWLPDLTRQLGDVLVAGLRAERLEPGAPAETYSTPRRLAARIQRLPDHQSDLEELVNGPPVSAGFAADGSPTQAAIGFAARQGVDVPALERVETPKGVYLAFRKKQRGRAASDVLPTVLATTLRGLKFPKLMHWDALLDDGRGDLLFGRPIRWLLYLYGGRVVPFTIGRNPGAQSHQVQEVRSGASTYGHRFLTTSGRAGRAIKVKTFDDYRTRLLEHFVILERSERHDKIARELDARAQRLQGRVGRAGRGESSLLEEVPDLVEYPAVVAGTFSQDFLELPDEVLRTTLIHHQHYFPVEAEDGRLKPAFLAVTNTEPEDERTIARNAERVVAARLRDARFFWEADRRNGLASHTSRLGTLLFHRKLGTYSEKVQRIAALAEWIARSAFEAGGQSAAYARTAGSLAKSDLTSDMVREFTELQGTMGGIYAREEGQPEEVWKAIYYHYLPIGVEADAPPHPPDLGAAGPIWAAVSLADKLDTIVGLFAVGEKPTGSRDPFGLRRAGHGVVKILADLPLFGVERTPTIQALVAQALQAFPGQDNAETQALRLAFWFDRLEHLLRQRGISDSAARAVLHRRTEDASPLDILRRAEAIETMRGQEEFVALARLFKRVNNIVHDQLGAEGSAGIRGRNRMLLTEPAEVALRERMDVASPQIVRLAAAGSYVEGLKAASELGPLVDRFFTDVLVMTGDEGLRHARLALLGELRDVIWEIADIQAVIQDQGATT